MISENATRLCFANGSWDQYSNYTSCKELSPLEVPEVELTTTIYFIGYTVSLVALLFAVYIFWKFKWVARRQQAQKMRWRSWISLSKIKWRDHCSTYFTELEIFPQFFFVNICQGVFAKRPWNGRVRSGNLNHAKIWPSIQGSFAFLLIIKKIWNSYLTLVDTNNTYGVGEITWNVLYPSIALINSQ